MVNAQLTLDVVLKRLHALQAQRPDIFHAIDFSNTELYYIPSTSGAKITFTCNVQDENTGKPHGVQRAFFGSVMRFAKPEWNRASVCVQCKKAALKKGGYKVKPRPTVPFADAMRKAERNNPTFNNTDFSLINPDTDYTVISSRLTFRCLTPGHGIFTMAMHNYVAGRGCPDCGRLRHKKLFVKQPKRTQQLSCHIPTITTTSFNDSDPDPDQCTVPCDTDLHIEPIPTNFYDDDTWIDCLE